MPLRFSTNKIGATGDLPLLDGHLPTTHTEWTASSRQHGIFDAQSGAAYKTSSWPSRAPNWWQILVAKSTRRALCEQMRQDVYPHAIWQSRLAAFDAHVAALTATQCAAWYSQSVWERLNWLRRLASGAMFPGQSRCPKLDSRNVVIEQGLRLIPQCIITDDHAVLDGMLFQHEPSRVQGLAAKPPIVVAGGNTSFWEDHRLWLRSLASETKRDVLVINPRRFGASVGGLCTSKTVIRDMLAALLYAQEMAPNAPLSVIGISLGGGSSAAAIASLRKSQRLSSAGVAHWVGIHTFASLPSVLKVMTGIGAIGLWEAAFWMLGFDTLDTQETLRAAPLAKRMSVLNAARDAVIPAAACLRMDAPWPDSWSGQVSCAEVTNNAGHGHGDVFPTLEMGDWVEQLRNA